MTIRNKPVCELAGTRLSLNRRPRIHNYFLDAAAGVKMGVTPAYSAQMAELLLNGGEF